MKCSCSDFKDFIRKIKSKGGCWNTNDVYFSQTTTEYTAAYLPKYPKKSDTDQIIIVKHVLTIPAENLEV